MMWTSLYFDVLLVTRLQRNHVEYSLAVNAPDLTCRFKVSPSVDFYKLQEPRLRAADI